MKKYLLIFAFLASALAGIGCSGQTAIVEINGKAITRDDLGRAIDQLRHEFNGESFPEPGTSEYEEVEKRVTQRLINDEVLRLEADIMGIRISDEEVNAHVDQQRRMLGGEEQFVKTLSEQGTTEAQFTENIRKSLLFQMIYAEVTRDIPGVTEEEALQYYSQKQDSFRKPEMRRLRHIPVADEETAKRVKVRLDAKEDFASLAKEFSMDLDTKDNGGNLGMVKTQESGLSSEIEQTMAVLAVGQTSKPVKTGRGYDILRVDEIIPASQEDYAQVKERIKEKLDKENELMFFQRWLDEARGRYEIIIKDEYQTNSTIM